MDIDQVEKVDRVRESVLKMVQYVRAHPTVSLDIDQVEKVDRVRESVLKMVQYIRAHPAESLELEVRVGKFTSEHDFVAGYPKELIPLVTKLLSRLSKSAQVDPTRWQSIPKYQMIRAFHDKGLRQTCRPGHEAEFTLKQQIGKLDLMTDRSYHLRVSLCKENTIEMTKNHPMYNTVTKNPPVSVRYVQRASFLETVNSEIIFQWDISKTSSEAPNKIKAAESPCSYHCEVELKTKLAPLEDKVAEKSQDELITDLLLTRAQSFLGTTFVSKGQFLPLPPPKLVIINSKHVE